VWAVCAAAIMLAACRNPPPDPLQLDGNRLTVNNQPDVGWTNIEIWLNRNFRVTAPGLAAHGRLDVPLDAFVSGYSQRFNYRRAQITSLRLTGKRADATPFELTKQFEEGGLVGALGGKKP